MPIDNVIFLILSKIAYTKFSEGPKYVFLHNFKGSRKKYGVLVACCILLFLCILRGIGKVVIWHESFWDGFLYPFILFVICSAITLPLYVLSKKAPKVASIISTVLFLLGIGFIVLCILVIILGFIRSLFA